MSALEERRYELETKRLTLEDAMRQRVQGQRADFEGRYLELRAQITLI
jgi:hypothetical protein